jgi:hypothetical protein
MDKTKIPYVLKILNDRLNYEKKFLIDLSEIIDGSKDEIALRWANGNINSCQSRISQIESVLEFINNGTEKSIQSSNDKNN